MGSKKPHSYEVRPLQTLVGKEWNLDNSILRAVRLPVNWKNLNR